MNHILLAQLPIVYILRFRHSQFWMVVTAADQNCDFGKYYGPQACSVPTEEGPVVVCPNSNFYNVAMYFISAHFTIYYFRFPGYSPLFLTNADEKCPSHALSFSCLVCLLPIWIPLSHFHICTCICVYASICIKCQEYFSNISRQQHLGICYNVTVEKLFYLLEYLYHLLFHKTCYKS